MNEMGAKSAYVRGLPGQGCQGRVLCRLVPWRRWLFSPSIMSNSEDSFWLVLSFHHVIPGDRVGVGSNLHPLAISTPQGFT